MTYKKIIITCFTLYFLEQTVYSSMHNSLLPYNSFGHSPLHVASWDTNKNIALLLRQLNKSKTLIYEINRTTSNHPNNKKSLDDTPLHLAIIYENWHASIILFIYRSSIKKVNANNKSCLSLLEKNNYQASFNQWKNNLLHRTKK